MSKTKQTKKEEAKPKDLAKVLREKGNWVYIYPMHPFKRGPVLLVPPSQANQEQVSKQWFTPERRSLIKICLGDSYIVEMGFMEQLCSIVHVLKSRLRNNTKIPREEIKKLSWEEILVEIFEREKKIAVWSIWSTKTRFAAALDMSTDKFSRHYNVKNGLLQTKGREDHRMRLDRLDPISRQKIENLRP